MSCVLLFFSPSLKYCTKGIRDGEHLVDSRSWLTRVCCIGSRGGDAMPFRTGPHLGGGQPPEAQIEKLMPTSHWGLTTTTLMFNSWISRSVLQLPKGVMDTGPWGYTRLFRGKILKMGWRPLEKYDQHSSVCEGHSSPGLWMPVWGRDEPLPQLEEARLWSLCSLRLPPHLSSGKVSKTL